MNKSFLGLGVVSVLAAAVLSQLWHQPQQPPTVQSQTELTPAPVQVIKAKGPDQQLSAEQRQAIDKVLNDNQTEQIPAEVLAQMPTSLKGAPLPSALATHDDGTLVINIAVRQYYDYFLTAIGEEPLELIAARVKHQLSSQLQDPALSQALDIFVDYLAYRDDLAQLLYQDGQANQGEQDYHNLRAQIKASRDIHFDGQVIEAFFAEEDSYDEYMYARSQLNNDDSLSLAQKRERAKQLLANAPQWLQQQHQRANQLNDYYQAEQKLKAVGAGEEQIQQLRELSFGPEAADRMAALAEKREVWQGKLADYHQQVQNLLNSSVDSSMLQTEVVALRAQYFDHTELLRVAAIDSNKFGDRLSF